MLGVGVSSGKNRAEEAALVSRRGWRGGGLALQEGAAVPILGCATSQQTFTAKPTSNAAPPPVPAPAPSQAATSAPLIERSIERATGIVYNITGGKDLTLQEVNRVSEVVTSLADPSANVIFGAVIDDAVRLRACGVCWVGV